MKKTLLLSLIATILLVSCKKDKEDSIKGKWAIDNYTYKEYVNNTLTSSTTAPGDGTTVDFQDNGNVVIIFTAGPPESYPYTIKPDSKVEFDGETYEIKNLSASTVTLFAREDWAPGEYDEISINLKR